MEENKDFVFRDKRRTANPEVDKGPPSTDEAEEAAKSSQQPAADKKAGGRLPPPETDFSTFVLSLSTSAAMSMGGYDDPVAGAVPQNLDIARQSIDILGMLRDKTKGNLDADEERLLESALYELRMRYVEELRKKGS
ncbi:MAG: DUF1844 domain-containing protein [Nitrospinae bacterium]|nr:DUF1844 domain-containing protein [Nitrospinota bacterium]